MIGHGEQGREVMPGTCYRCYQVTWQSRVGISVRITGRTPDNTDKTLVSGLSLSFGAVILNRLESNPEPCPGSDPVAGRIHGQEIARACRSCCGHGLRTS